MQKTKVYLSEKKGSVLAYSLIILTIMIAIVATISTTTMIGKKGGISTDASSQAFQIADSGAQLAIKKINEYVIENNLIINGEGATLSEIFGVSKCFTESNNVVYVKDFNTSFDSGTYTLYFFDGNGDAIKDCDITKIDYTNNGGIKRIKSVGEYKGTIRAVDINMTLTTSPLPSP